MRINFVEEAMYEFLDAVSYYESARSGLGQRFKDEIDRCVLWVADHPELYRSRPGGYRIINCRIFPYYIAYVTRDSTLWVLAVAQGKREPEYWIKRRPKVD